MMRWYIFLFIYLLSFLWFFLFVFLFLFLSRKRRKGKMEKGRKVKKRRDISAPSHSESHLSCNSFLFHTIIIEWFLIVMLQSGFSLSMTIHFIFSRQLACHFFFLYCFWDIYNSYFVKYSIFPIFGSF